MWTPSKIVEILESNDDQVCKAIVNLYNRQTEDEKMEEHTNHKNYKGFNAADARMLSSFAKQYNKLHWLSEKQIAYARKRLYKYSRQLCEIANS